MKGCNHSPWQLGLRKGHGMRFTANPAVLIGARKTFRDCVLLIALLFLVNCGGSAPKVVHTEFHGFSDQDQLIRESSKNAVYRLRVGDRFKLDFKYEDQLDQEAILVLPDGSVSLAGIGVVPAAGFSITQLDSLLTERYSEDYVHPDLSVIVNEIADLKVFVTGEVNRPGAVDVPSGGGGVLQCLTLAGGFTKNAKTNEVLLIRIAEEGYIYRVFDMSHISGSPMTDAAYLDIQPFDIIYVPRSALGDLAYFSETMLGSLVRLTDLFWDIYAVSHLDKVNGIYR